MFGTRFEAPDYTPAPTAEEKAASVWARASFRYKELWLKRKGFHQNHAKVVGFWYLPQHVRKQWITENESE